MAEDNYKGVFDGHIGFFFAGCCETMTDDTKTAATVVPEHEIEKFLNTLDSGDIVLFDNKSKSAKFLKLMQGTHFDHVGLVVRDMFTGRTLVLEAVLPEVCLFELHQRVASAKVHQIAVRRLLGIERDTLFRQKLQMFTKETVGKPYEQHRGEMVKACFPGCSNDVGDDSSLFCSELVAAAYQAVGLLPASPAASNYLPADFSTLKKERLPFLNGASLSERIVVTARKAHCW